MFPEVYLLNTTIPNLHYVSFLSFEGEEEEDEKRELPHLHIFL